MVWLEILKIGYFNLCTFYHTMQSCGSRVTFYFSIIKLKLPKNYNLLFDYLKNTLTKWQFLNKAILIYFVILAWFYSPIKLTYLKISHINQLYLSEKTFINN